jgi:hypothetical protein
MHSQSPNPSLNPRFRQLIWWRARGNLGGDQALHQATAAYASDFSFLETALLPHGFLIPDRRLVVASLDHSMWFHRPFRADDWLLYQVGWVRIFGVCEVSALRLRPEHVVPPTLSSRRLASLSGRLGSSMLPTLRFVFVWSLSLTRA